MNAMRITVIASMFFATEVLAAIAQQEGFVSSLNPPPGVTVTKLPPAVCPIAKWLGKTSPTGPAVKPRLRKGLPPFAEPCARDQVRYKNGCAQIVETHYDDEKGRRVVVPGLPKGCDIGQTMEFAWHICRSRKAWIDPPSKGIDADGHARCVMKPKPS